MQNCFSVGDQVLKNSYSKVFTLAWLILVVCYYIPRGKIHRCHFLGKLFWQCILGITNDQRRLIYWVDMLTDWLIGSVRRLILPLFWFNSMKRSQQCIKKTLTSFECSFEILGKKSPTEIFPSCHRDKFFSLAFFCRLLLDMLLKREKPWNYHDSTKTELLLRGVDLLRSCEYKKLCWEN